MICQNCLKNVASVHVTEIVHGLPPPVLQAGNGPEAAVLGPLGKAADGVPAADTGASETAAPQILEQHLCEVCAQNMDLPHLPVAKKSMADIWKLLQLSAQQTRKKGGQSCPDCGMSLEEFRKKGRLGCPKDYEVFKVHIGDLLERVHGSRTHVGRIPGTSEAEIERIKRLTDLRGQLEVAIREEAYENAARLRDELKALEESTTKA